MRIIHNGVEHIIYDNIVERSYAEYLMLKRKLIKLDDEYVVRNFKKGKQLLFNTNFLKNILDTYGELHCEFCNKELELILWYDNHKNKDRSKMASADHFFPKSSNKELLSFNLKNMVVSCCSCNFHKDSDIVSSDTIKFPYPKTIENLIEVAKDIQINKV